MHFARPFMVELQSRKFRTDVVVSVQVSGRCELPAGPNRKYGIRQGKLMASYFIAHLCLDRILPP